MLPCDQSVRWRGCQSHARFRLPDRKFRACKVAGVVVTSYDEHLAVGKQCCRVKTPPDDEAAGRTPGSARRIVQFRARKVAGVKSSCDEHLAVRKQCCRVTTPCGGEAAGGRPSPARRIVQFRARKVAGVVVSSCDEDLAVGEQRLCVLNRAMARLPVMTKLTGARLSRQWRAQRARRQ